MPYDGSRLARSTGHSVQVCRYRSPLRPLLTAAQDGGSCGFWRVARYLSACPPSRRGLPRSKETVTAATVDIHKKWVNMANAGLATNAFENPGRVPGFFAVGRGMYAVSQSQSSTRF